MDNTELIKQAALNATNELLKKNGMTPIDIAKDYVDADIGNPILIRNVRHKSKSEFICVPKDFAEKSGIECIQSGSESMVWVKKSALDLAKEAIKRKESIGPRMPRAK